LQICVFDWTALAAAKARGAKQAILAPQSWQLSGGADTPLANAGAMIFEVAVNDAGLTD
jgi:hypothetical protein